MFRSSASVFALAVLVFVAARPAGSLAAPGNGLVSHRAVYDLTLQEATERSGIDSMTGRMVYEFEGSLCEGYSTRFRLVTRIRAGSDSRMTDQQTTTYENLERTVFRFANRSYVDGGLDTEVRGVARGTKGGLTVALKKPDARHVDLPKSLFPTAFMLDLIKHARVGERFYQSRVFDGSEDADRSMLTTVVIGRKRQWKTTDSGIAKKLPGNTDWPVSVAYFKGAANGDETPEYRIAFKLHASGIIRDLTMDYGDFVLRGTLVRLDLLKQPSCP